VDALTLNYVSFTVGFDLDMTLIDPRQGMIEVFDVLADEFKIPLDGVGFVSRLGPPLAQELARYHLDAATVTAIVNRYRDIYPGIAIPQTVPMPGAVAALQSVTARGGRAVVVTAKYGPNARAHLDILGVEVAAVVGDLWSTGKAVALQEYDAEVYVGDHLGDITGARAADAWAVAVATGPISAADLAAAGADVVLEDLTCFPEWLDSYLLATVH
jgi:phosphoglycolate phosphatase